MRAIIIFLGLLLLPATSYGQDRCPKQVYSDPSKQPDFNCPGPGEDALMPQLKTRSSVGLEPTEPAPWAGVLMDRNRVYLLGLRIKALRRIRWEEIMGCGEILNAEIDYITQTKQATIDLRTSQRDNYREQTKDLQKEVVELNKWYRSPALWFATGFVVAAAGAVVVVVVVRE